MQEFLNSAQKKGSYSGLNVFKMAVMDVTQPKLNMQNQIIKIFNNIFATDWIYV